MYLRINLIFMFTLLFSCKVNHTNLTVHKEIVDTVKLEEAVVNYSKKELKTDDVFIFISDRTIPFNLNSLEIDIIKKKYIENFNPYSNHSNEELAIIKTVSDSLSKREIYLNKHFIDKVNKASNVLDINKANYVLFFSDIVDNSIYAKLLPYNSKINNIDDLDSMNYGTGFSFLFELNDKKNIIEKYSGIIHLN